jgi:hypothetical protein
VTANNNNAPAHIKNAITSDITKKIYIDQPNEILKIETKNKYYPFASKTAQEVQFIISTDLTDEYNKTLYVFFDKIFAELEYDAGLQEKNFYLFSETMQRALLDVKVNKYTTQVKQESFDGTAIAFGSNEINPANTDSGIVTDVEAEAKARLKGSVGGVQGILDIQQSVAEGITERSAALAILDLIYGISQAEGERILGEPKMQQVNA